MFKIDLLNIFEGLVRNYSKFNLNKKDNKGIIIKKEIKYIEFVGEILGYSSIIEKVDNKDDGRVEVIWREYNDKLSMPGDMILKFYREDDITKDVFVIQSMLNDISKKQNDIAYMQIVDVLSKARIDYLNNLIQGLKNSNNNDILMVYKVPYILEEKTYFYAYLFKGNKLIRERRAISYIDIFDSIKLKFQD